MSRIDDLIAEHCPRGVDYIPLGELVMIKNGRDYKHLGEGDVPVYGSGGVMRYVDTSAHPGPSVLIPRKGSLDNIFYVAEPFWTVDTIFYTEIGDRIDGKYLYYFLVKSRLGEMNQAGGVPSQTQTALKKIRVPLPSLVIQREIVSILDRFTELETELERELETELSARRLQYQHYRTSILSPGADWQKTTIGEIAEVFDGPHATPRKTSEGPWYLSISSLKDGAVDLTASAHLAAEDLPRWTRRVEPQPGDTLFSYETRIGQAGYWDCSEPAALGRRMGLLRPRGSAVVPRFLTIAYLSPEFQSLIESKTVRGSTVDRISIADLPNWPISIPSVDDQRRIIELLEQSDALVNDLSSALPAELRARRQQYEYYRNRLLTFEELPV